MLAGGSAADADGSDAGKYVRIQGVLRLRSLPLRPAARVLRWRWRAQISTHLLLLSASFFIMSFVALMPRLPIAI